MTRGTQTRWGATATVLLVSVLAGCGHDDSAATATTSGTSEGPALHVVATVDVAGAFTILPAGDRFWVIAGGTGEVTQVDPSTDRVTKVVSLPHPAAYATLTHGSLWLVSYYDDALMEVDARTGNLLRTLERSRTLPLSYPGGVVATGHDLWIVNHRQPKLLRVDARTGKVSQTTSLAGHNAGGPSLVDGSMWVSVTREGLIYEVDSARGKVVGRPIPVESGLCLWASVVGSDIWFTSVRSEGFNCQNGTSRLDTTTGEVSSMPWSEGKGLYTFTRYAGALWATDDKRTVYQVDEDTGALRTVMTLPGKPDANHLFTAFGSLWMTRSGAGEVLRLDVS